MNGYGGKKGNNDNFRNNGNNRSNNGSKPKTKKSKVEDYIIEYRKLDKNNYVNIAENAIKSLEKSKNEAGVKVLTTSKIRNLLAMTAAIYNDIIDSKKEELSDDIIGDIQYLKVRFLYESGREPSVKAFTQISNILKYIDDIDGSREGFILFSRYMEALVAFRKFLIDSKDE